MGPARASPSSATSAVRREFGMDPGIAVARGQGTITTCQPFRFPPAASRSRTKRLRAAVETALFEMGLTRPMTLAEKEAFCETANVTKSEKMQRAVIGKHLIL